MNRNIGRGEKARNPIVGCEIGQHVSQSTAEGGIQRAVNVEPHHDEIRATPFIEGPRHK